MYKKRGGGANINSPPPPPPPPPNPPPLFLLQPLPDVDPSTCSPACTRERSFSCRNLHPSLISIMVLQSPSPQSPCRCQWQRLEN